jgi:hypothetical protein
MLILTYKRKKEEIIKFKENPCYWPNNNWLNHKSANPRAHIAVGVAKLNETPCA